MTVRGIEGFIQSGSYRELKQLEAKAKILKGMIRDEQSALKRKRMVWKRLRVVGQFQYFSMYEYNQLELNEYLYDLGLLLKSLRLMGIYYPMRKLRSLSDSVFLATSMCDIHRIVWEGSIVLCLMTNINLILACH